MSLSQSCPGDLCQMTTLCIWLTGRQAITDNKFWYLTLPVTFQHYAVSTYCAFCFSVSFFYSFYSAWLDFCSGQVSTASFKWKDMCRQHLVDCHVPAQPCFYSLACTVCSESGTWGDVLPFTTKQLNAF